MRLERQTSQLSDLRRRTFGKLPRREVIARLVRELARHVAALAEHRSLAHRGSNLDLTRVGRVGSMFESQVEPSANRWLIPVIGAAIVAFGGTCGARCVLKRRKA